jgi:hypothetical protein
MQIYVPSSYSVTTTYTVAEHVGKYCKATPVKVAWGNEPILTLSTQKY